MPAKKLTTQIRKHASVLARIGEITGIGRIAALAVDASDSAVARLVKEARLAGVSERKIVTALRAREAAEQAQNLVAVLLPVVPAPAVLRALAGRRK